MWRLMILTEREFGIMAANITGDDFGVEGVLARLTIGAYETVGAATFGVTAVGFGKVTAGFVPVTPPFVSGQFRIVQAPV